MKTLTPLIAACAILTACDLEVTRPPVIPPVTPPVTPPPPAVAPTYALFGIVRDEKGLLIEGAQVMLIGGGGQATTNQNGSFIFTGLKGSVQVGVTKFGYESSLQSYLVNADLGINVSLRATVRTPSNVIEPGRTIQSTTNESPCDPVRWDARAPCRRFHFIAPSAGSLAVTITFAGAEMDATIVSFDGRQYFASTKTGPHEVVLSSPLTGGAAYEIRVNSYYDVQAFYLRAEFIPDVR